MEKENVLKGSPRAVATALAPISRVALVTGGIGGIGSAVCRHLCDAGHRVYSGHLPSMQEQALLWQAQMAAEDYRIELAAGDVCSFDSCQQMIARILQQEPAIEILVNASGITRDATLRKMDGQQWQEVLQTNLDGVFNVTRQVVEGMTQRGFGRIINISSVNGQKGQFGQTNYSASKAAVHGFTMALAQELATAGITVNTIAPGYIKTPMTDALPDAVLDAITASIPLGRFGQADEIARVVYFLSEQESSYITGAELPVNGGLFMS